MAKNEASYNVIRVSKVSAVQKNGPGYSVLLDGGHSLTVSDFTAKTLSEIIVKANVSDEGFFNRGA